MALIGGFALRFRRDVGKAPQRTRVVDLRGGTVLVFFGKFVAREEVGICASPADSEQARRERARARANQIDAAALGFAWWGAVSEYIALRLPLVGVFLAVEVAIDQAFGGVKEDQTVVANPEAICRKRRLTRGLLGRGVAK